MWQTQIQINNSPVAITCFSDSSVGFSPLGNFPTTIETYAEGKVAMFDTKGFSINTKEYKYSTKYFYKTIPDMLEYLVSLKMEMPTFR